MDTYNNGKSYQTLDGTNLSQILLSQPFLCQQDGSEWSTSLWGALLHSYLLLHCCFWQNIWTTGRGDKMCALWAITCNKYLWLVFQSNIKQPARVFPSGSDNAKSSPSSCETPLASSSSLVSPNSSSIPSPPSTEDYLHGESSTSSSIVLPFILSILRRIISWGGGLLFLKLTVYLDVSPVTFLTFWRMLTYANSIFGPYSISIWSACMTKYLKRCILGFFELASQINCMIGWKAQQTEKI